MKGVKEPMSDKVEEDKKKVVDIEDPNPDDDRSGEIREDFNDLMKSFNSLHDDVTALKEAFKEVTSLKDSLNEMRSTNRKLLRQKNKKEEDDNEDEKVKTLEEIITYELV